MKIFKFDNPQRIWELDFLRGIALILMVFFHLIFDLTDIYGYKINYTSGIIFYIGRIAAILFIFIAGISSTLSKNNLKRGTQIFAIAMIITLVTHFAGEGLEIKFGILHFMGLSMIIYHFLSKLKNPYLVIISIVVIILGNYFSGINASNDYLFIFNLTSRSFYSSDYYPIFPWIGLYLIGVIAGRYIYKEKMSVISWRMRDNFVMIAGRNTLLIYLMHQPLLLAILTVILRTKQ